MHCLKKNDVLAQLSQNRVDLLDSLAGIAGTEDITPDNIKRERLIKTGIWNGEPFEIADDFDEPLDDFKDYMK